MSAAEQTAELDRRQLVPCGRARSKRGARDLRQTREVAAAGRAKIADAFAISVMPRKIRATNFLLELVPFLVADGLPGIGAPRRNRRA
jgi:hypothetical protein